MTDSEFTEAYRALVKDVATSIDMKNALSGRSEVVTHKSSKKRDRDPDAEQPLPCLDVAARVLKACREARARKLAATTPEDISDAALSIAARFTDKFSLKSYEHFLHYVPRLVNVVTVRPLRPLLLDRPSPPSRAQLAETIPRPGSGITLPLDLHHIAARCKNSFYAPKKFSAVQLAYAEPRCRVLIFRARSHSRTPRGRAAAR
tara:strand:+ start:8338 stop:8949 length:612 start_codon:yes stop_codon:yes gene_type:complete